MHASVMSGWICAFVVALIIMCLPQMRRMFRHNKIGVLGGFFVTVFIALNAHKACTKSVLPDTGDRLGNLVMWLTSGRIFDPSGVVAQYSEAAAIDAFESETAGIIVTVSNGLVDVSQRLAAQTRALETNNIPVIYLVADAPRDLPGAITNHNLAVTQERMVMTGTNTLSVFFRYSWEVTSAAYVEMTVRIATNQTVTLEPITNSFPTVFSVNGSPCYRYDYDVTALNIGTNGTALIPPYEADFGGASGEPFEVPGLGLEVVALVPGESHVTTNTGFTGWINELPEPWGTNLHLRCVGGEVVEALWHGTNITGVVAL